MITTQHRQLDRDAVLARLQRRRRQGARQELRHRGGLRRPPRPQPAGPPRPRDAAEPDRSGLGRRLLHRRRVSSSTTRRTAATGDGADSLLGEPVPGRGVRRPERDAEHGGGVPAATRPTTSRRSTTPISSAIPACSALGPFAYFAEQYDSLAAQSSIGRSEYDALQLTLRKRFSHGLPVRLELHAGARQGSRLGGRARQHLRQLRVGRLLGLPRQLVGAGSATTRTRTSTCGTRST